MMRIRTTVLTILGLVLSACATAAIETPPTTPDRAKLPDSSPTSDSSDAATGTLSTQLGSVKWWRVSDSLTAIPYPDGGLVDTASGYLAAGSEWDVETGFVTDSNLWHSTDGLNWQVVQTPLATRPKAIRVLSLGGEVWLETLGPSSLWHSPDGEAWTEVSLPVSSDRWNGLYEVAEQIWLISSYTPTVWRFDQGSWVIIGSADLAPPDVTGLTWTVSGSRPAIGTDTAVISWSWEGMIPWEDMLGFAPDENRFLYGAPVEPGIVGVFDVSSSREPIERLTTEIVGNTINLRIEGEDAILHSISVLDAEVDEIALFEALWVGVRMSESVMAVSTRASSVVPAPWSRITTAGFGSEPDTVITTSSGFLSYVGNEAEDGTLAFETWTSSDGSIWVGPRVEDFGLDNELIFRVRPVVTELKTLIGVDTELGEHLMSPEDESVSSLDLLSATSWRIFLIGSGWLAVGETSSGDIWASNDLTSWQQVNLFEAALTSEPVGGGRGDIALAVGDRLFIMVSDDELGIRRLWMLDLSK